MNCTNNYYLNLGCGKSSSSEECPGDDCCEALNKKMEELIELIKEQAKNNGGNGNGNGDGGDGDGGDDGNGGGDDKDNGDDNTVGGLAKVTLLGGTGVDTFSGLLSTDDGYIACGYTASPGATVGSNDALLVKFDKSLNLVNKTTIGGSGSDVLNALTKTKDGGYLAVGKTNSSGTSGDSDCLIVSMDAAMNVTNKKFLNSAGWEALHSVVTVPVGFSGVASYVATGLSSNVSPWKAFIVTLDKDFNVLHKARS